MVCTFIHPKQNLFKIEIDEQFYKKQFIQICITIALLECKYKQPNNYLYIIYDVLNE